MGNATIREQADALRKEANVADIFPVPITKIAEYLGYRTKGFSPSSENKDFKKISGVVLRDKKEIWLNNTESKRRQRFTAAHEIGHIKLHSEESEDFIDFRKPYEDGMSAEECKRERDANFFAAELLMPAKEFEEIWHKHDLHYVTEFFAVSPLAASIRADALGLEEIE